MLFKERFLSELLDKPVLNLEGRRIGKSKEVIIALDSEFPKVSSLIVSYKRKEARVPWEKVALVTPQFITLSLESIDSSSYSSADDEIFLKRDILDKQIIDTQGAKVVRVNDLKLAQVEGEVRLVAAEVGILGILRRLGLEKSFKTLTNLFGYQISNLLISWNFLEPISSELTQLRLTLPYKKLSKLHPSDIAQIISQLSDKERLVIFNSLAIEVAAETLHELEPGVQTSIIEDLDEKKASKILDTMPSDEAADVLGGLPEDKTRQLMRLMKKEEAEEVGGLLKHDDNTAGGLMTTEYITFSPEVSVEEVIKNLRELAPSAETIYYLYVADKKDCLVGVLSLRDLIVADPKIPIKGIMHTKVISVREEEDVKEVAEIISKYNFLALPVIDKGKKLIGIITVDDVVDLVIPPLARRKHLRRG